MRVLLSCVAENNPGYHTRVENLLIAVRTFGGRLSDAPFVVNVVGEADDDFQARIRRWNAEVRIVERYSAQQRLGAGLMNKLRMLDLASDHDFDVLLALDCDVVMVGDPYDELAAEAVSVAPADLNALRPQEWTRLLDTLGVTPGETLRSTADGDPMPPYFNSGVVGVPRELAAQLRDAWVAAIEDITGAFDRDPFVIPPPKHFFGEQIGLAVALQRAGLPYHVMSPAANFPTHVAVRSEHGRAIEPFILHYHADLDQRGFLVEPRARNVRAAAHRFNEARARELGQPYSAPETRPRVGVIRADAERRIADFLASQRWYHAPPARRVRRLLRRPAA